MLHARSVWCLFYFHIHDFTLLCPSDHETTHKYIWNIVELFEFLYKIPKIVSKLQVLFQNIQCINKLWRASIIDKKYNQRLITMLPGQHNYRSIRGLYSCRTLKTKIYFSHESNEDFTQNPCTFYHAQFCRYPLDVFFSFISLFECNFEGHPNRDTVSNQTTLFLWRKLLKLTDHAT